MLVFTLFARLAAQNSLPASLALLVTWAAAGIPIELGILFYHGWQRNGRLSLEGIVLNRERVPLRWYTWLVPPLIVWTAAWSTILIPMNETLRQSLFAWWPEWMILSQFARNLSQYPSEVLLIIVLLSVVMNIAVPIVEELYFRGYLLPRIPAGQQLAPLINVILFSTYHFWLPWEFPTRILSLLPVVYAVQWKQNMYIGVLVHVLLNTLGTIGLLVLVMGQG
jgi:membrane protease YdiL (CAAX protease family)